MATTRGKPVRVQPSTRQCLSKLTAACGCQLVPQNSSEKLRLAEAGDGMRYCDSTKSHRLTVGVEKGTSESPTAECPCLPDSHNGSESSKQWFSVRAAN